MPLASEKQFLVGIVLRLKVFVRDKQSTCVWWCACICARGARSALILVPRRAIIATVRSRSDLTRYLLLVCTPRGCAVLAAPAVRSGVPPGAARHVGHAASA